jgi:hypothetical protein
MSGMIAGSLVGLISASACGAAPTHLFLREIQNPVPNRSFTFPCGVATDSRGDVYVASSGDGIVDVLGPSGDPIASISGLNHPCSVAVDSQGALYVKVEVAGGSSRGEVKLYEPNAYPLQAGAAYGLVGTVAEGEVGTTMGAIAVDPLDDHLFVNEGGRVREFDSADAGSAFIRAIGSGKLSFSFGLDVDGTTSDVFATSGSGRVQVVDPETNEVLREVPEESTLGPLENIALDQSTQHLFVFDRANGVIREFDASGVEVPLGQIGPLFGDNKQSLVGKQRVDVAVDNGSTSPNKGDIYVVTGFGQQPRLYVYGPLEEPRPTVVTEQATNATESSASLHGTVNPNGIAVTDCHFELATEADFESEGFSGAGTTIVPCAEDPTAIGTGHVPVPVEATATGLAPGAYRFRLVAENENPPAQVGGVQAFGPPEISAVNASPIAFTEASVNATVNPEGLETTAWVEYGPTEAYGLQTPPLQLGAGITAKEAVMAKLAQLSPGTEYHYRVVAENEVSREESGDETFVTAREQPQVACPNAAQRVGPSAGLPDCRAYELVTPAQMNGLLPGWPTSGPETGGFATSLATPAGGSLIYATNGTLPGTNGNGVFDVHRSVRTDSGWVQRIVGPSGAQTDAAAPGGVSEDHDFSFWAANGTKGTLDNESRSAQYLHLEEGVDGSPCASASSPQFEYIGCGEEGIDPAAVGRWISSGGSHVIFTSSVHLAANAPPTTASDPGSGTVYERRPGSMATVVSLLPADAVPASASEIFYEEASRDGSAVVFRIEGIGPTTLYERVQGAETLTVAEGPLTFAGIAANGSRVFYEAAGALHVFNAGDESTTEIAAAGSPHFVNVSADGTRAYFSSTAVLGEGVENEFGQVPVAGQDNLYVWDGSDESVTFVALLDHLDVTEFGGDSNVNLNRWATTLRPDANGVGIQAGPVLDPSRTTPDGRVLVFQSHAPLTGVDSNGRVEIFRYDASTGGLACISCSPTRAPATTDASLQSFGPGDDSPLPTGLVRIPNVSNDGHTVFFQTGDALVPADVNGRQDVYEWRDGAVSLISSGRDAHSSFLYAMSDSGDDVFVSTRAALVSQDEIGGGISIYDARVFGGFAPAAESTPCSGDACQGSPTEAPRVLLPPPTADLSGGEGAVHPRKSRCAHGHRRALRQHGHRKRCGHAHGHAHGRQGGRGR